jgi:crotonobetainyl-CoA:carnitine CoA-transferase CaiB-like acyl-CoA transferase
MFAVQGLLMALYWRDALGGGKGQVVDAAISESCFTMMESSLTEYDALGIVRQPSGTGLAKIAPSNIYPTSEGKWIVIAANLDALFRRLCTAMEKPEWAEDPRFKTHEARGENQDELDGLIAEWTKTKTAEELDTLLDEHGVVCGPINTIADIAEDPQFLDRGMVRRFDDPLLGDIAIPGITPRLTETGSDVAWLGPPEPGYHNDEIYGGLLGLSEAELADLRDEGII